MEFQFWREKKNGDRATRENREKREREKNAQCALIDAGPASHYLFICVCVCKCVCVCVCVRVKRVSCLNVVTSFCKKKGAFAKKIFLSDLARLVRKGKERERERTDATLNRITH